MDSLDSYSRTSSPVTLNIGFTVYSAQFDDTYLEPTVANTGEEDDDITIKYTLSVLSNTYGNTIPVILVLRTITRLKEYCTKKKKKN